MKNKHDPFFLPKVDPLALSTGTWCCPQCGTTLDRDINAATNILTAGLNDPGDLRMDRAFVNAPREVRTRQIKRSDTTSLGGI